VRLGRLAVDGSDDESGYRPHVRLGSDEAVRAYAIDWYRPQARLGRQMVNLNLMDEGYRPQARLGIGRGRKLFRR
jgi:hypothetical protein